MKFIEHIEGLFSEKLALIKEIFSLIILEAKLARLNIAPLLIHLILILPLLITIWLSSMFALGYVLLPYTHYQLLIDILLILLLNCLFLIISVYKIKKTVRLMCFDKTRNSLSLIKGS